MSDVLIVSRHPAAIEFLRRHPLFADAPVIASATADDVRGKIVGGNLPLHLAALADQVVAVEFTGVPPRGQEYTIDDMMTAGAVLRSYRVTEVPLAEPEPEPEPRHAAEIIRNYPPREGVSEPCSAPIVLLRWLSPDEQWVAQYPYPVHPKPGQKIKFRIRGIPGVKQHPVSAFFGAFVELAGSTYVLDEDGETWVSVDDIYAASTECAELPLRVNRLKWVELEPWGNKGGQAKHT